MYCKPGGRGVCDMTILDHERLKRLHNLPLQRDRYYGAAVQIVRVQLCDEVLTA